jgi:aminomethyltransferase
LLASAAFAPLDVVGWLRVTGSDRVRWLNGMVTNSIQSLKPGEGCYNFVLNAQGRIQADLTAWLLEDSILLQTDARQIETLRTYLDRFIIMDDVELTPHSMGSGLLVVGPHAPAILESMGFHPQPDTLRLNTRTDTREILIHAHSPLVPKFEIWSGSPEDLRGIAASLHGNSAAQATPETLTYLRLLEGTPLYGTDIRNSETAKDLPQETAQARALHFAKGCYLGQEIVERIRSRGNVHRTFSGFVLSGDLPPAGTQITSDDPSESSPKPIGEFTSLAALDLPSGPIQLALGYIRREALDLKKPLRYAGGSAIPSPLPFPAAGPHPQNSASD